MKRVLAVCRDCGHEERIEIWTREEAERENVSTAPPRCKKCRSRNIKLCD